MDRLADAMVQLMESQQQVLRATAGQQAAREPRENLAPLTDNEDVDAFLSTFERTMVIRHVDEDEWTERLIPVLTGKARVVYNELEADVDYFTLKEALLERFGVTPGASQLKFRQSKFNVKADVSEHLAKMSVLVKRWLVPPPTPQMGDQELLAAREQRVVNELVLEQFCHGLPSKMLRYIDARGPKTVDQLRTVVQEYQLQIGSNIEQRPPAFPRPKTEGRRQGQNNQTNSRSPTRVRSSKYPSDERRMVTCYKYRKQGHYARDCTEEESYILGEIDYKDQAHKRRGTVNGGPTVEMWLDTGCTRTTVQKDLIPKAMLKAGEKRARVANGEELSYRLADVVISIEGRDYPIEAAVADALPVPVLLGRDMPWRELIVQQLIEEALAKCSGSRQEEAFAVVTREQTRQEKDAEKRRQEEEDATQGVANPPNTELTTGHVEEDSVEQEESTEDEAVCPFADDLFAPTRPVRIKLTRSQKREEARRRVHEDVSGERLRQLQQKDEDVQCWRVSEDPSRVLERSGVLLRKWKPRDGEVIYEQIILPKEFRQQVLKLAHSIPIAGHLGKDKTARRILRRFYWPTVFQDVKKYCQQCPECQLTQRKGSNRAPMISLPVMGEPFERITMDIIGPLPKTRQGHRYVLVVCDYATRYPEAIPLKKFTAPAIAEELIGLFSRHGVPREILTDQGTNFTSQLLKELYQMIGVTPIKTSPYHPQTDGLVERFNQTLKQML